MREKIRSVRLRPYLKGKGPTFSLEVFDTGRTHRRGTALLAYELREGSEIVFSGEDFSPSPMHAIDSDGSIGTLLSFLTLRPGDADAEYFERYTPRQLRFASEHAEALSLESVARFGES